MINIWQQCYFRSSDNL